MTYEEVIAHLASVVSAVFRAEGKIRDIWLPRLRECENKDEKYRSEIADKYIRAIAEEMAGSYGEEELTTVYNEYNNFVSGLD